jgi:hypothetical protein
VDASYPSQQGDAGAYGMPERVRTHNVGPHGVDTPLQINVVPLSEFGTDVELCRSMCSTIRLVVGLDGPVHGGAGRQSVMYFFKTYLTF